MIAEGASKRQLERIAVEARHFFGHLGVDDQVFVAGVEFHGDRGFGDRDITLYAADLEADVDGHVAARLHQDVLLDELVEACHFHRHRIRAGIDIIKEIQTGSVGLPGDLDSGVHVERGHVGAHYDCFTFVCNDAFHTGTKRLRPS